MNKDQLLLSYTYATLSNTKQDGAVIREKNKMHMNQLMSMSVNLLDKNIIQKIVTFLLELPDDYKTALATYLKGSNIKQRDKKVNKILGSLTRLITSHNTQNPDLKELLYEYKNNINQMATQKETLMSTTDLHEVSNGILQLYDYYKKNGDLIEKLKSIKDNTQKTKQNFNLPENNMNLTGNGMHLSGNNMNLTGNGMHLSGNNMNLTGNGMHLSGNNMNLTGNGMHLSGNNMSLTGNGMNNMNLSGNSTSRKNSMPSISQKI